MDSQVVQKPNAYLPKWDSLRHRIELREEVTWYLVMANIGNNTDIQLNKRETIQRGEQLPSRAPATPDVRFPVPEPGRVLTSRDQARDSIFPHFFPRYGERST